MIRNPKINEIKYLKKMWQEIFGDTEEYIDLFFKRKFSIENTFVFEKDNIIVSVIYAVSEKFNEYDAYYICGVSTLSDYRNQGISGRLMEHMLQFIENKNVPLCFLIPATKELFDFYRKFGFCEFSYLNHKSIKFSDEEFSKEFKTNFDYERLSGFYNEISSDRVNRSYDNFLDIFNCYKNFRIYKKGYLIYSVSDDKITILEHNLVKIEEYARSIMKEFQIEQCEIISHYDEFRGFNKAFSMVKTFKEVNVSNVKNNYVNLMLN